MRCPPDTLLPCHDDGDGTRRTKEWPVVKGYGKLVRDRIPEIIKGQGKVPVVRVLPEEEYRLCLQQKLREEVDEYIASGEVEELADVLEVIMALLDAEKRTYEELEEVRARKRRERGGFDRKLFLVGIEEPE